MFYLCWCHRAAVLGWSWANFKNMSQILWSFPEEWETTKSHKGAGSLRLQVLQIQLVTNEHPWGKKGGNYTITSITLRVCSTVTSVANLLNLSLDFPDHLGNFNWQAFGRMFKLTPKYFRAHPQFMSLTNSLPPSHKALWQSFKSQSFD